MQQQQQQQSNNQPNQQNQANQLGKDGKPKPKGCRCRNSKCLKHYCECFHAGNLCSKEDCECTGCENQQQHHEKITQARETRKQHTHKSNNKGCNCKKSNCLKGYCECFAAEQLCGPSCSCVNCRNVAPSFLIQQQQQQLQQQQQQTMAAVAGLAGSMPVFDMAPGSENANFVLQANEANLANNNTLSLASTTTTTSTNTNANTLNSSKSQLIRQRSDSPPPAKKLRNSKGKAVSRDREQLTSSQQNQQTQSQQQQQQQQTQPEFIASTAIQSTPPTIHIIQQQNSQTNSNLNQQTQSQQQGRNSTTPGNQFFLERKPFNDVFSHQNLLSEFKMLLLSAQTSQDVVNSNVSPVKPKNSTTTERSELNNEQSSKQTNETTNTNTTTTSTTQPESKLRESLLECSETINEEMASDEEVWRFMENQVLTRFRNFLEQKMKDLVVVKAKPRVNRNLFASEQ